MINESKYKYYKSINLSEPVKLIGEGKYNLNALKEIEVTDSYLGLSQEERGCQYSEHLDSCKTRKYIDNLMDNCGCIPLNIQLPDMVNSLHENVFLNKYCLFRNPYAPWLNLIVSQR